MNPLFNFLKWAFNIERNIADRSDFVVTVCSQNLIIGKYVLNREEFVHIPDTNSGFFEVKGSILNGVGLAGNVKLVFQKGTADRPSVPKKQESPKTKPELVRSASVSSMGNGSYISNNVQGKDIIPAYTISDPTTLKFIFVKVISIAVIEMKPIHLLESNSPSISAECGKWVGVTDVVRGAGAAARWSSLNWKFSVKTDEPIVANVTSNSKLIGTTTISMSEIVEAILKANGMKEVVKHINNGKEITGRIKFNFVVKVPEEAIFATDEETGEEKGEIQLSHRTRTDSYDSLKAGSQAMDELPSIAHRSTASLPSLAVAERMKLRPPFIIRVSDLTVLDTIAVHLLTKNVLSVNVACGAWGSATDICPHPGQYAHFMNLNWTIPVMEGSNFRINVWSRGTSVGACALSLKELLQMPTDNDGNTEMFAKILNEKKEITGKVKLSCRYEPYVKDNLAKKAVPSTPLSRSNSPDPLARTVPMSSTNTPPTNKHQSLGSSASLSSLRGANNTGNLSTAANASDAEEKSFNPTASLLRSPPRYEEPLTLPVKAILKSISVFDLYSVHMLRKNSPQVLFKV